jgi:hypothetical protein
MANKTTKSDLKVEDRSRGNITDTEAKIIERDNGTATFEDSVTEKVTATRVVEGAGKMDNVNTDVNVDYIETPVVIREKRIIDPQNIKNVISRYNESSPKAEAKKEELARKAKANK